MKRTILVAAALTVTACNSTSSTEVGVRTSLIGILESRGAQQVYSPGGVYFVMPIVNSWATLPIHQQNLLMNVSGEGDRPIPDDIVFKTSDGNNVHIDVNLMWRIDPKQAAMIVRHVGQSAEEIKERVVRPIARSVIRDVFNEITSEQYYQVTVKNEMAGKAREQLATALAPYGVLVDMLQVQQHRFDPAYQDAINAQKQAEADVQTLIEQQKAMVQHKQSELEAKRAEWNKSMEDALGEAGRTRNDADAYYQTQTNKAKALIAEAQAEAQAVRKEAAALEKLGGEAYVKIQLSKRLSQKRVLLVPSANVSTMNVNQLVDYLVGQSTSKKSE